MSNPIRTLKSLPWGEALQVAAMVMAAMLFLEWLIEQFGNDFSWLSPRVQLLLNLAGGGAMGWAATELWLYRQRSRYVDAAIIWTLVGSLLIVLSLRWLMTQLAAAEFFPLPILTDLNSSLLICLVLGGFWRSWRDRLRR